MPGINNIFAVILGGGRGTRLHPLTQVRSKPAISIAGKYRLIDIPISNCVNSGIGDIAVLTQFNSASLHRHIASVHSLNAFHGSVQILAAAQTPECADWYQGTADAVRKQMVEIQNADAEYTLILAGDHLYRMNYEAMAKFHRMNHADVTVAVQPIARNEASRFGILECESDSRITSFFEKPTDPVLLDRIAGDRNTAKPFLGSMGIYMFNTRTLIELLTRHPRHDDFGGDVIPEAIHTHAVYAYAFEGYWRDVGTIRSFYETNLDFTMPNPPFDLYSKNFPIYTAPSHLPCSVVENSQLKNVILADGCRVRGAKIEHSIIGFHNQIAEGAKIKNSIVMGMDSCSTENQHAAIGANCSIEGAILDNNVRLGAGVVIRPFPRGFEMDGPNWVVRDGIVVIPKNMDIAPKTVIVPETYFFGALASRIADNIHFESNRETSRLGDVAMSKG